ncbi:hypothetical protein ACWDX6_02750 [Streptomyces sp. NPDC003027]
MARHAHPRTLRRGALLKAGLTATAAGAAVLALAATAQAAPVTPAPTPVSTLLGSDATELGQELAGDVGRHMGPLSRFRLDPEADTEAADAEPAAPTVERG